MSVNRMVIVLTLCVMVRKSLGLTWKTETLTTTCCEGQDILLMWNYSLEKNETVESIEYFYNRISQISYESESIGFRVSPLYKGRVERHGTAGILLKNVSSVDTGEYTLYTRLATEQTGNTQTIFLTVYESPTYQCKPNITIHSKNTISCLTNSCGGQQFSLEWRILGKRDPVGNESSLIVNSSWNAEFVFCCLRRLNMQCHNGDQFEFCASTTIFFPDDKNGSEINTVQRKRLCYDNGIMTYALELHVTAETLPPNTKATYLQCTTLLSAVAPNCRDTENTSSVMSFTVTFIFMFVVFTVIVCWMRKKKINYEASGYIAG